MTKKISEVYCGKVFVAEYAINDDILVVYLPDGTIRRTELRGLNPESAAKIHLRSYAIQHN